MKIKALTRPLSAHQAPGTDAPKLPRNIAPESHPFERAREYTRALNSVKLERMFAQPFICSLGNGHQDGVYEIATDPNHLSRFASASGDGIVKLFDLTTRDEKWSAQAHSGMVKGLAWTKEPGKLLTCGQKEIKLFAPSLTGDTTPISTWLGANTFTSLSHHRSRNAFAASISTSVHIYDLERHTAAPEVLGWPNATDPINKVAFNQVEQSILATTSSDRSIVFYDLRTGQPLSRTTLQFSCNSLAWNPQEAFNIATCSEDHNVYIFDMRKMDRASNILRNHVAAVMSVQYSPTGQELVTGSYDRTIRLWDFDKGHSRDIYHTKRMGRVFSVSWTPDSKFVLSGSDEGNIRLWRSQASKREGIQSARQRQAIEYNNSLIQRYSHMPEVRRIKRHRHVPKAIKKAGEIKAEEIKAIKRRQENVRKHSKQQFEKRKNERDQVILAKEK